MFTHDTYRVTHNRSYCKDDLKLLKYDDIKGLNSYTTSNNNERLLKKNRMLGISHNVLVNSVFRQIIEIFFFYSERTH